MIREVVLRNWRSHENSKFEFGKGTNILIGPMGSGKSSILDALCFALFGNFPALQHRRVAIKDMILNRPEQKKEAEVRVDFDWGGSSYSISRKIKLNGVGEAEIRKNGKMLQGPQPERVSNEVERILKIDYDLFTRAVYSEQNRIDYFLTLGRGERKEQIDELLGISKFESVRKNLSNLLNRIKDMKKGAKSILESVDITKIEKEEKEVIEESKRLEVEISELEKTIEKINLERVKNERELEMLTKREKEYGDLRERKTGLEHTLVSKRDEIAKAKRELRASDAEFAKIDEKDVRNSENRVESLREEYVRVEKELASLESKKSNLIERIEEKNKLEKKYMELEAKFGSVEELKKTIEKENLELSLNKEKLAELKNKVSELKELILSLEKEVTKCPVCEAPLSNEKRIALKEKRKSEESEYDKEFIGISELVKIRETSLKEHADACEKFDRLCEEIKGHSGEEKELDKINLIEAKNKREASEKEKELKACEEEFKRLNRLFEIKKNEMSLLEFEKEVATINAKLDELKFDEKELEEKKTQANKVEVEESKLKERHSGIKKEIEKTGELLRARREELEKHKKLKKEIEKYDALNENLLVFQNSIVETQKVLRENLIEAINSAMNEVWGVIYPYKDYKEVRMKAEENDYELQLKVRESWIPVEGIASGGERYCAAIALKIAFAMVLVPNIGWLILDEPTHNLDEEGIRALAKVLNEEVPKIVEQVFVITHDENLKDAASARVYKLDRNKAAGESTKVEIL
jgi:exonuclease SbcC